MHSLGKACNCIHRVISAPYPVAHFLLAVYSGQPRWRTRGPPHPGQGLRRSRSSSSIFNHRPMWDSYSDLNDVPLPGTPLHPSNKGPTFESKRMLRLLLDPALSTAGDRLAHYSYVSCTSGTW